MKHCQWLLDVLGAVLFSARRLDNSDRVGCRQRQVRAQEATRSGAAPEIRFAGHSEAATLTQREKRL